MSLADLVAFSQQPAELCRPSSDDVEGCCIPALVVPRLPLLGEPGPTGRRLSFDGCTEGTDPSPVLAEEWKAQFIRAERRKLLHYKARQVRELQPRVFCPFAGYFVEAHPSDRYGWVLAAPSLRESRR